MKPERLSELIERFPRARIAVVGDFFLDKYLEVDPGLAELSIETNKVAHQVVGVRCSPGAAGTVVANLASLGAGELIAVGFCGDDGEGYDLRHGLLQLGCAIEHLHIDKRVRTPTYLKPRDRDGIGLTAEHSRYDTKNRRPTPQSLCDIIMASLANVVSRVDGMVILDQVTEKDCGVITAKVRDRLGELAGSFPRVIFWADSRRHIQAFRNVYVKVNEAEILGDEVLANQRQEYLRVAAQELRMRTRAPVFVTRGEAGIVVTDPSWTEIPGVPVRGEIDSTGAGDSVSAGAILSLCSGAAPPEAALVGNLVASITVQQLGRTGTAKCDELFPQLTAWSSQPEHS
jgi:bifunctional ADP-heptose synthase (sugar kinase/adenylyltransferase)